MNFGSEERNIELKTIKMRKKRTIQRKTRNNYDELKVEDRKVKFTTIKIKKKRTLLQDKTDL